VREARAGMAENASVEKVIFACFGDEVYEAYRSAIEIPD
jgi:hypothetical protein